MAKTSVVVAWSFELYLYHQLTVPQVSDGRPLATCLISVFSFEILQREF